MSASLTPRRARLQDAWLLAWSWFLDNNYRRSGPHLRREPVPEKLDEASEKAADKAWILRSVDDFHAFSKIRRRLVDENRRGAHRINCGWSLTYTSSELQQEACVLLLIFHLHSRFSVGRARSRVQAEGAVYAETNTKAHKQTTKPHNE